VVSDDGPHRGAGPYVFQEARPLGRRAFLGALSMGYSRRRWSASRNGEQPVSTARNLLLRSCGSISSEVAVARPRTPQGDAANHTPYPNSPQTLFRRPWRTDADKDLRRRESAPLNERVAVAPFGFRFQIEPICSISWADRD
jgi:hypothetical protein